ncbi:MAG: hypothetical protein NTW17_00325, partial [Candidatus Pacearchaeota archaeon]|nr:hypothetical protein [Candidatus Pacearchaeota archaeon]
MSPEEKIKELGKTYRVKRDLEAQLENAEKVLSILNHMPDVVRYKAIRDRTAMAVLSELKRLGDVSYDQLISGGLYLNGHRAGVLFLDYMDLFIKAKLIEITPGYSIYITEKGKEVKYVGKK